MTVSEREELAAEEGPVTRLGDASHDAAVLKHSWSNFGRRRIWMILVSIMVVMLLSALDQTVVGTAMPRVIADLNGMEHYAWVATAYLLASTASMPIWGKLSDAYGRKLFYLIGILLFVAGSALCGQAHTMTELIIYRGLQGLGAGAMMPIGQAIIGDLFTPVERGKWIGLLMSVFGFATIIGPTLGGWITDNWGWRWTFYINLPVGIIALAMVAYALPGHVQTHKHKIDYSGAAMLIAASVPVLLGFSWAGSTYAWGSPEVIGCFVFSVVMWILWVLRENRALEPIISPNLFKNRTFSVSAIAGFIAGAGMFGAIMFLPLFVQGVQGNSATNSGMVLTPMMLGFIVSSIVGGQILSRTGKYKVLVITSYVITLVGLYLLSRMGADTTNTTVIINMIVTGLGMGIGMSAFTIIVQNDFPLSRLGEVTAGLQFFRSIGGTIGMAIFGAVLNNRFAASMHHELPAALKGVAAKNPDALNNPQVLVSPEARDQIAAGFRAFGAAGEKLFHEFMAAVKASLAVAISDLFLLAVVLTFAGLLVLFFLKEKPLRATQSMNAEIGEGDQDGAVAVAGMPAEAAAESD